MQLFYPHVRMHAWNNAPLAILEYPSCRSFEYVIDCSFLDLTHASCTPHFHQLGEAIVSCTLVTFLWMRMGGIGPLGT